jgi:hypothetical protein
LYLANPSGNHVVLRQGSRLTVCTLPPSDLIASRLIRYDPTDQADIQFLLVHSRVSFEDVARAVARLPDPFRDDALVRDHLQNLHRDLVRWMP